MSTQVFPTKGNLMAAKRSLSLAKLGYELMDKKRNILIREMMNMLDTANEIQSKIDRIFNSAYVDLQNANVTLGIVSELAKNAPLDDGIAIKFKSVMGVEIPIVSLKEQKNGIPYGFFHSNSALDKAYISFIEVKKLCAVLAEIENGIYRLANAVKRTQKRANALKNIIIPDNEHTIKYITEALEEKDREEFTRLKVIKAQKTK